jgi:hypothetical protein
MNWFSLPAEKAVRSLCFDLQLLPNDDHHLVETHPMLKLFQHEASVLYHTSNDAKSKIVLTTRLARAKYQAIPETMNPLPLNDDIEEFLAYWKYYLGTNPNKRTAMSDQWNATICVILKTEWWFRIFQVLCMRWDIVFLDQFFEMKPMWCNPFASYRKYYSLRDTSLDGLNRKMFDANKLPFSATDKMHFEYRRLCHYCTTMTRLLTRVWEYIMFGHGDGCNDSLIMGGHGGNFVKELLQEHEHRMAHFGATQ